MKKLIYILFIIIGGFTLSCDNFLDLEPEISVTNANVWTSENDAVSVFNSLQYYVRWQASAGYFWLYGEVRARNIPYYNYHNYLPAYNNELETFSGAGFYNWNYFYRPITVANLLIDNIDAVPMAQEKTNYIKGSAYFNRAFSYFQLLKLWGEVPLVTATEEVDVLSKSTKKEVQEQILSDALKARELLKPWSEISTQFGSTLSSKQYTSRGAVDALLSHFYAWIGSLEDNSEYIQLSIDYATDVIESGEYTLVNSPEEVVTQVMYGNSTEGIFELEYTSSEYGVGNIAYFLVRYPIVANKGLNDWVDINHRITIEYVEDLYDEAGDLRKEKSYFYEFDSLKVSYEYAYPYKWRTPLYSTDGRWTIYGYQENVICFRLADILLLRAENYNKLGQTTLAITDLNTIRHRAGLGDYSATINGDLKLAILKERNRELYLEGHRFFDLIRNDELRNQVSTFEEITDIDIQDGAYYIPVPEGAFSKNPAMRQNVYWKRNGF